MDKEHQEHLARILENRRRRGVKAPGRSDGQLHAARHHAAGVSSSPLRDVEAAAGRASRSPLGQQSPETHRTIRPLSSNIQPISGVHKISPNGRLNNSPRGATGGGPTDLAEIKAAQKKLSEEQAVQMALVRELLDKVSNGTSPNRSRPEEGSTVSPRSRFPRSRASGVVTFADDDMALVKSPSSAKAISTFYPRAGVPTVARPFRNAGMNVQDAITLLKTGEWFLKWNAKLTRADARYVWLSSSRYTLVWGPKRSASILTSDSMDIEKIQTITSSQVPEYDGDTNRIFYVVNVQLPNRSHHLATEKREKHDRWFAAFSTLIAYHSASKSSGLRHSSSD